MKNQSGRFLKVFILLLVEFICSTNVLSQSPSFLWAKQMGGGLDDIANSVKVDASGNVYTTGYFQGTADFDPGPGTFTFASNGLYDIFISKIDASGNFVWAKQMGGTSYDGGNSLVLDNSGNIYTTGYFYSTVDFDPGIGVYNLSPIGGGDIFISKLDASGNFVWAKQIGGSSDDQGFGITLDALNNVYTTGSFQTTANFDNGVSNFTLTSVGGEDIFISKLGPSGNFIWAKQMGGPVLDDGYSITVDASFNIYTTGAFRSVADFDPGVATYTLSTGGNVDNTFISKLDASGNFVWAKQITGISNGGASLIVDNLGNTCTLGNFSNTSDFDPGAGSFTLTSNGLTDIFILKLDASGNFVWVKQIGGSSTDGGYSITIDTSNKIYVTGGFIGTVDFDPGPGIYNLSSLGNSDICILILDALGNFMWAKQMGGSSNDNGTAITLDASNNIYTTGRFQTTANFDNGASNFTLTSAGNYDCFVNKMSPSLLGIKEFGLENSICVYPNPVVDFIRIDSKQNDFANTAIEIINTFGQTISKTNFSNRIDVSEMAAGFYILKIINPNGIGFTSKFIKE